LPGKVGDDEIAARVERVASLADELMDQRAADRIGEIHDVLIEELPGDPDGGTALYVGRAAHQAPEVDGTTQVRSDRQLSVGDLVRARVSGSEGVDLLADVIDGHEQGHPGQIRTID